MSKKQDGGPAFPIPVENDMDCRARVDAGYGGISLRDYLAAKAMQGFCATSESMNLTAAKVAAYSYEQADAMLKARNQ